MRLLAAASLSMLPALSTAFLLPPPNLELTAEQLEQFKQFGAEADTSVWNSVEENTRLSIKQEKAIVRTKCVGCEKLAGEESDLVFEIEVSQDSKHKLTINDATVFPLDNLERLKAYQIAQSASDEDYTVSKEDGNLHAVALGYDLSIEGRPVNHENERPIMVNLRISTVDGVKVNDKIDDVQVIITEDMSSKELEIQKFVFVSPGDPLRKENSLAGCDAITCIMRKLMLDLKGFGKDKFRKFRHGCKGRKNPEMTGAKTSDAILAGVDREHHDKDYKRPQNLHPHHHHHSHHHGHGHMHHGFFLARLIGQVLVPIFIGVGAGMIVGLVGLLIGQLVAAVWLKFRSVKRDEERGDVEDESAKGLLVAEDYKESMDLEAPPAYVHDGIEPVEKE
ncbi:hypothetical protein RUND412_011301 [Rhizina undulata]